MKRTWEEDIIKVFLKNTHWTKYDIFFTDEDKKLLKSKKSGIIYRDECGGLFYYNKDNKEQLPAKLLSFIRWGWVAIDDIKTILEEQENKYMTGKEISKKINKITGIVNELSEVKNVDSKLITRTIKELNSYQKILQKTLNETEIEISI